MPKSYTMRGVQGTAQQAVLLVVELLDWLEPGSQIHDVQADPRFQGRGVDLLWEKADKSLSGVEVKGDRHARSGNYYLELVSNLERDTPGCFLYSTADWLMYVFVEREEVHRLPLAHAREWFLPRAKEFPIRPTSTRIGKERYTTLGALVPVRRLLEGIGGEPGAARRFRKRGEAGWEVAD